VFSFVIDKVGYGRAAAFGLVCHVISTVILLTADSARMLYWGTFIFALSNGTVEACLHQPHGGEHVSPGKGEVAEHPACGLARRYGARRHVGHRHG
jgi:hypothetical protein